MVWTGMILVHKKGCCGKRPTGTASGREANWTMLRNDGSREPLPTYTHKTLIDRENQQDYTGADVLQMITYLY
jgi:hypothetical protein